MAEFDLNEGDLLTKTTRYEVLRQEDRLFVDVHEVVAGNTDFAFVAIPTNVVSMWADRKYWGSADSEQEALAKCLANVKGVGLDVMFPEAVMPASEEDGGPVRQ